MNSGVTRPATVISTEVAQDVEEIWDDPVPDSCIIGHNVSWGLLPSGRSPRCCLQSGQAPTVGALGEARGVKFSDAK